VWRQHRWEGASALSALAALGGAMLVLTLLGTDLVTEIDRLCPGQSGNCNTLRTEYNNSFGSWDAFLGLAGVGAPVLIGIFVGAPLMAREFELGTHLLVWAQGITRRRWFVSKVLWIATATLAGTAALGAAYAAWVSEHEAISDRWFSFDVEPPVLIAYSLFALMLGIAYGSLIQRTIAAMAATLVTFIAVRVAIEQLLRPVYLPPLTWILGKTSDSGIAADWFLGPQRHVDLAGHPVSDGKFNDALQACSSGARATYDCLLGQGIQLVQRYQPAYRFWLFQGIEAAIFLTLALVLAAFAYGFTMKKS
jgi:hypothetical protein